MRKIWDDKAWEDYLFWQLHDKRMLKRLNALIRDVERAPFDGLGKPEPLRGNLSGFWSRRIDDEHRLVYRIKDGILEIISCRDHYERGYNNSLQRPGVYPVFLRYQNIV